MSLLHVIFYLKGVLVGKEYFSINHLLYMPSSHLTKQEGHSKVRFQRILHDVSKVIYFLHMDVIFASQNENLPKENSRKDMY